tara:strand:+ start:982 stop:1887 length:906 start_codon:yes stop_codon:yes gene_type:complete
MNSDSETVEVKDYDDSYANQINSIIDTLDLESETHRKILKSRFLAEVLRYEKRKDNTKKYYNVFRFIVTIGSILLPAILSIGQMDPAKLPRNFDQITYWSSWTISLMVTASNGFLQLFSLDKNYFEYAITTEQLKTEGWQYFQLAGKYEDDETHQEAYKPFCKSIENIKRKQVEKEFSGKGDVNKNKKGKKEKQFDFQEELMRNLPDHLKPIENKKEDIEKGKQSVDTSKVNEIGNLVNDKIDKLDKFMGMLEKKNISGDAAATIGNVKEIFTDSIKEQATEAASKAISETIDKVEDKKED